MAAPGVIDIDPISIIIILGAILAFGYIGLRAWAKINRVSLLTEKRGIVKQLLAFYTAETVPTIRIKMIGDQPVLELGKRAVLRGNSLADRTDRKGWGIQSKPIPMVHGSVMEMGYITHPAGCTVDVKTNVKVIASDENGNPIEAGKIIYDENNKPEIFWKDMGISGDKNEKVPEAKRYTETKYIDFNFEGTIGTQSDLDDFNESSEREQSRGWVVPLIIGIIAGVVFFAPLFAWLMAFVAKGGH